MFLIKAILQHKMPAFKKLRLFVGFSSCVQIAKESSHVGTGGIE